MNQTRKNNTHMIWMIQVRRKGSNHRWSATGREWYSRRKDAKEDIGQYRNDWPSLEYRIQKYTGEA